MKKTSRSSHRFFDGRQLTMVYRPPSSARFVSPRFLIGQLHMK